MPKRRNAETPTPALIERAVLLILLALVPLRALLSETTNFEVMRMFRSLPAPPSAQPATTFLIIVVIVACAAVLAVLRFWRGGPRYRWTGAELGAGLLAVAAVISTWQAGQKHLAIIGSLDFLALVVYLLTLRQVVTRPWHLRLTLAVVLGTAAMVVAKCGYQHWIEFPETIAYYEREYKAVAGEDAAGQSGDTSTSGLKYDYEQRLLSQLVSGYFGHSNVLGSFLILVVMSGIGLAAARYGRLSRWTLLVPLLITAGGLVALVAAQSKGAAAACAVALLLWIVAQWGIPRWIGTAARRHLWIVLWLGLLAVGGGLVAALHAKPDLLGRSMLYRYLYWQGAVDMIRDQGPLGVGADNFGRHFPRYKPVECPEEVESPHSWVVEFAAEWGILGLVGALVMFVGISRRLAMPFSSPALSFSGVACDAPSHGLQAAQPSKSHGRNLSRRGQEAVRRQEGGMNAAAQVMEHGTAPVASSGGSIVLWAAGIGAIALGSLGLVLTGADPGFRAVSILVAAIPWAIGFLAAAIESRESTTFADDLPGPMLAAIGAGLVGFLLHSSIDLAMFRGGAATTFFALSAVALAARETAPLTQRLGTVSESSSSRRLPRAATESTGCSPLPVGSRLNIDSGSRLNNVLGSRAFIPPIAVGLTAAAAIVALLVIFVQPSARLADDLHAARINSKPSTWGVYTASPAYAAYLDGSDAYRLDGTAVEELLDELIPRSASVENVDAARRFVQELQQRDPDNSIVWHDLALLHYRRFELGHDPADLDQAVAAMRAAVAAYPTSPAKRLMLGDMLERQATITKSAEGRLAAAAEYQQALDLDARSIYISKPHHLRDDLRAKISARIAELLAPKG